MRRSTTSKKQHDTAKVITTKTPYGSHLEMVVDKDDYDVIINDEQVLCEDEKGVYVTLKNRIDSGLADPNRYSSRKTINKKVVEAVPEG
jgi:hypothetical protein